MIDGASIKESPMTESEAKSPNKEERPIDIRIESLTVWVKGKLVTITYDDIVWANLQDRWSFRRLATDEDILKVLLIKALNVKK